jgi:hypothetical protein
MKPSAHHDLHELAKPIIWRQFQHINRIYDYCT